MSYFYIVIFWCASFLVVYPYCGYPLLLCLLVRRRTRRASESDEDEPTFPTVSLIVSAYNEESVISAKLQNALCLDYPPDRIEILVVSDASTDRTDAIVADIASKESVVRLIRQPQRRGKSAGINEGVVAAHGDIVVFSDANALYEATAVRKLVEKMRDQRVGYAVGAALYSDSAGSRAAESEGLYWRLELFLKEMESAFDSVVGGDGAIYAARREAIEPLQDDDISDFVTPLRLVARGFKGKFVADAQCYEHAGESFDKEFRRKRRIVNRSWRAYRRYRRLLSYANNGRFLFMLISHKVVRWFGLPLITVAWAANTALLGHGTIYQATWAAITLSVLIALLGALLDGCGRTQPRMVALIYYFYSINLAGALGLWDEWRGVHHVVWNHIRNPQP
jgi:cellulose synthase/poly-beta-1,6-N-acetylglucosamine synthase-like glycosyltransferase